MRTKYSGNIGSVSARSKLKQRREPYWVTIARGCALGYRKGANGGTWIARVTTGNGGREYTAIGSADDLNSGIGLTYEMAQEAAQRTFAQRGVSSAGQTIGWALDEYLEHVKLNNAESTYYDTRQRVENVLRPALGSTRITAAGVELRKWRDKQLKKRSRPTTRRLLTMVKAALNLQSKNGVLKGGDWHHVTVTDADSPARKIHLTHEQCVDLLTACDPAFRDLCHAAIATGARLGELMSPNVRDFDARLGTLDVDGKTGKRTVTLNDDATELFKRRAKGRPGDAPLLAREDGSRWYKVEVGRRMRQAVKAAGLDSETVFYTLRHSHISLALLGGVNIKVLADNCGTSVRMIEKHYAKFLQGDRRDMLNKALRPLAAVAK